ncbi:MAG TPA: TonB-dependent receptor plug domain-containing protein, partial [Phenylobacterium sp.]|uniref:TonB-dependent receptor plug domain-containing protein n=1 Tax=Phenylobacterium sp. TaxID=1871053 RepID=UPI002D4F5AD4
MTKRRMLLGTTLLAGMAMAGGAWAQTSATKSTTVAANTPAEASELIVTGSRIPRPNLEQPTPVAVLSTQVIENAGPQNLGDIITELPSVGFGGALRANSNNFGGGAGAGISSIDLRNLGVARTLVLVDGQRHVAGDIFSNAVDINSIPPALVDRVEVVTGGASAIYGSDAVSGVVNIILKKRFEGLQADYQYGS